MRWPARRAPIGENGARAKQIATGVLVYLVVAVVAVVMGVVYLRPPGHRIIAFDIADAISLKVGTEVRVAGLPVGKVEAVRLGTESVHVQLTIDRGIYLGDQTAVDIRMLTPAGGYYINLMSAGDTPQGSDPIPTSRARPPYQLPDLLADSADKLDAIDATPLGIGLDQLATGLEANPGAITTIADSMQMAARIVNRQQDQLQSTLTAVEELMRTTATHQTLLVGLLQKASVLIATLDTFKVGFTEAYHGLATVFLRLGEVMDFYDSHRDWIVDGLNRVNDALNVINTDVPRIMWNLGNFTNKIRNALVPPGVQPVPVPEKPLLATDMCVPIPGRTC